MNSLYNQQDAYASWGATRKAPTKIIDFLITNDECNDIWKLIYYNDTKPLEHENLTIKEKRDMIAKSSREESTKHIILQKMFNESLTDGITQLRIEVANVRPYNGRTSAICTVLFQVIVADDNQIISTNVSPYDRRDMAITQRLVEVLNGCDLEGVGRLHIDNQNTGANSVSFNKMWSGFQLYMDVLING